MIRTVLFVDLDQIMLLALQNRLEKYDDSLAMILAEDGFEAAHKLAGISVSLVVLDLKIPRMDGVSLLTHISAKYPDIPIIVLSAQRTEELDRMAQKKDVVACISKPFQPDDLVKVILSTLRKEAEGGTLHQVSPVVFLQLMEMESRTCTIRLVDRATEKRGVLFFKEGQLYDARVDQTKGINAAYIIFTWEEVTLFIQNDCLVDGNVINSSLQPIIMNAVGMKDEQVTLVQPEDELPEIGELIEEEQRAEFAKPLQRPESPVAVMEEEEPRIDKVRDLLLREIGEKCGLADIYHDSKVEGMIHSIAELGAIFRFGSLRVGYIGRGKPTDEVLLPGEPPIAIKVSSKCPQDKIIQILSTQM